MNRAVLFQQDFLPPEKKAMDFQAQIFWGYLDLLDLFHIKI